jgi:hypothetical protein
MFICYSLRDRSDLKGNMIIFSGIIRALLGVRIVSLKL